MSRIINHLYAYTYSYTPETQHVCGVHTVADILSTATIHGTRNTVSPVQCFVRVH